MSDAPKESRRQMFRTAARWTAGGGLAVLCAGLAAREPGKASDGRCLRRLPCTRCRLFVGCDLPRAVAAQRQIAGS